MERFNDMPALLKAAEAKESEKHHFGRIRIRGTEVEC